MARYIRTKDGEIFDTEVSGAWETNDGTIGIPTTNGIVVTPKAFIIKQADTIEELCDEYVVFNLNDEPRVFSSHFEAKNYHSNLGKTLYGAIWTDKGLIYKAKLNEKGELELL